VHRSRASEEERLLLLFLSLADLRLPWRDDSDEICIEAFTLAIADTDNVAPGGGAAFTAQTKLALYPKVLAAYYPLVAFLAVYCYFYFGCVLFLFLLLCEA
jgi:hypothetical protein